VVERREYQTSGAKGKDLPKTDADYERVRPYGFEQWKLVKFIVDRHRRGGLDGLVVKSARKAKREDALEKRFGF